MSKAIEAPTARNIKYINPCRFDIINGLYSIPSAPLHARLDQPCDSNLVAPGSYGNQFGNGGCPQIPFPPSTPDHLSLLHGHPQADRLRLRQPWPERQAGKQRLPSGQEVLHAAGTRPAACPLPQGTLSRSGLPPRWLPPCGL